MGDVSWLVVVQWRSFVSQLWLVWLGKSFFPCISVQAFFEITSFSLITQSYVISARRFC
jgi:hypothetical protein